MDRAAVRERRRVRAVIAVAVMVGWASWGRDGRAQDQAPPGGGAPEAAPAPAPEPELAPAPAQAPAAPTEPPLPHPAPPDPQFLLVSAGLGISGIGLPTQSSNGSGTGFFGEVDYVIKPLSWLLPKAYAGVLFTGADSSSCDGSPCDVSAKIGFLGGKLRLIAPIPYVAPFIEGGFGISFGSLTTRTPEADNGTVNVTYNVPVSAGLALGESQSFEIGLSYLMHPSVGQMDGALDLSLVIPLN